MATTIREQLELEVFEALEFNRPDTLRDLLADKHPADIADVLERLNDDHRYDVFQLLAPEMQAQVLDDIGSDATRNLLTRMEPEDVGDLLDQMPMDEAVEILTEDVPEFQETFLAEMEPEDAAEIERLLQYPSESAGLLMTEQYVAISKDMTAAQALAYVRKVNEEVETVTNLYVLNGGRRLIGVISLRELITQPPSRRIEEFMETQLITVRPEDDQEIAARLVERYNFLALPVVNENNKMLGIITIDDIIDVLLEENSEDIMRFGGVEGGDEMDQPYFTMPVFRVLRSRFGWLLLLMLAYTLTDAVMRLFDQQLSAVVALTFYIPLLIGTGGNAGAQTVSTIIRGLAVQDIRFRDIFRVFQRELVSGFILGLALSFVVAGRSYLSDGDMRLSLVVATAIIAICTWANVMGAIIPMIAKRLGLDPALVSAPLISTLVDATGMFIYLSIATLVLGL